MKEIAENKITNVQIKELGKAKSETKGAEMTFETALAELEKQVAILEAGDVSLDAALRAFVSGTELAQTCQKKLDEAEREINKLVLEGRSGEVREVSFADEL